MDPSTILSKKRKLSPSLASVPLRLLSKSSSPFCFPPAIVCIRCVESSNSQALYVHNPSFRQLMVLGELHGKHPEDYLPFKRTEEGFEEMKEEELNDAKDVGAVEMWDLLKRISVDVDNVLTMLNKVPNDEDEQEEIKTLRDLVDLLGGEEDVRWLRVESGEVTAAKKWIPTIWVNME